MQNLTNSYLFSKDISSGVWIGLYTEGTSRTFKWYLNGQPASYIKWLNGEPNRDGVSSNENNCVRLYRDGFDFADRSCTNQYLYLCKQGKLFSTTKYTFG